MTSMKIEGGAQLAKALQQLSVRVSKNVLRETLKTVAAPPIQQSAAGRVARAPGAPDLADHIAISTARAEAGPTASVVVGPSVEKRQDGTRKKPISFGLQGKYLEFGTARTKMRAFMRPAFDQNASKSIPAIASALWHAIISRKYSTEIADRVSAGQRDGTL
jgi:HK97 gp10 family phage protein